MQTKQTKPTTRRRALVAFVAFHLAGASFAAEQATPSADAASSSAASDEAVMLSEFEVRPDPDDDYRASNVISGTKFNTRLMDLPKQVDVITDKFLEDLGTADILEALRYNPSIQLDTAEGVEVEEPHIWIRGYRADTTYVNGFSVSQSVDRIFVDRIEIIKGPSSIFSGPIEPGGTMNTITKKPVTRTSGMLALGAGSFDRYRAELSYNTALNRSKTLTTRVATAFQDYGSYIDFAKSRRRVFGGALQWKPTGRTTLLGEIRYTDTDKVPGDPIAWVNSSVTQILRDVRREFNRAGPDAFFRLDQWQGNIELTHVLNDHWSFRAGVLGQYRTLNQLTIAGSSTVVGVNSGGVPGRSIARTGLYRPQDGTYSMSASPQVQLMGKFTYRNGIEQKFLVGLESSYGYSRALTQRQVLSRISVDDPQPPSAYSFGDPASYPIQAYTRTWTRSYGIPVNNILTLMRGRLTLLNGARYGYVNNDGKDVRTSAYNEPLTQDAIVGGHGVTYAVIPSRFAVFASYSESFVPLSGSDWQGNTFEPMVGNGVDYGIKFDLFDGRVSGSIAAYDTVRDKGLARDEDHSGFFVQERKQRSKGLEAGIHLRPTRDWRVILNYGYCDIVTTGDPQVVVNNTRQRGIPKHQGNIWNRYKFSAGPLKGLSLGVGIIRLGNRRGNDTRADVPGLQLWPFTKVDASVAYDFRVSGRKASIQISGTNLLDREFIDQYRYFAAPRSFNSTLRIYF